MYERGDIHEAQPGEPWWLPPEADDDEARILGEEMEEQEDA